MITIYGIPNCDTVQKAVKWLLANNIPYKFHNFREDGLDRKTIENWLKHLPLEKVVNTRSTTFKELGDEAKSALNDREQAIALMLKHNTIIKRPVWDIGKNVFFLGWDEKQLSQMLK